MPNANYCAFEDWVVPILDKMLEEQEASKGTDEEINWTPSKVIRRLARRSTMSAPSTTGPTRTTFPSSALPSPTAV